MHEVRRKMKLARAEQRQEESVRLALLEEKLKEEERIKELRRKAVVERQIKELDALRKYEIKMLVRIDKEFSDITYVPTSSLGMIIDEICKRKHTKRNPEDALHLRPYYDYEETIKDFDKASNFQSEQIRDNPELLKKLQDEMAKRKRQEKEAEEEKLRTKA